MRTSPLLLLGLLTALGTSAAAQSGRSMHGCNVATHVRCTIVEGRDGADGNERRWASLVVIWREGPWTSVGMEPDTAAYRKRSLAYRAASRAAEDADRMILGSSDGSGLYTASLTQHGWMHDGRKPRLPDTVFVAGKAFEVPLRDTALVILIDGPNDGPTPPNVVAAVRVLGTYANQPQVRRWESGDTTFIVRPQGLFDHTLPDPVLEHSLVSAFVAATAPVGAPSTPRPMAAFARVDSIFRQYDRQDSPGCALGIYRNGRLAQARGYGMAVLEHNVRITPSTVFDLGSTGKQFTASAIVLLAQDGKLSLDDDVRRWIPELPEYQRPITIRHLLNHTSGLRDYLQLLNLGGKRYDDVTTADDALRAIVRQRELNFAPGDEHLYSNSGYFLLSVIVERASGQSLRDFARARIFDPLGMNRTHYLGHYNDVVPGRATGYDRQGTEWRVDVSRWLQTGDGAVSSTVGELAAWVANYEDPSVGGTAMRDALHERGLLANGDTLDYALGLFVSNYRGLRTVSHGGSWGGFRAELLRFPDERAAIAVLCNAGNADPVQYALDVADVVLADRLGARAAEPRGRAGVAPSAPVLPAAATLTDAERRALAGSYRSEELDVTWRLVVEDTSLVLHPPVASRVVLRPREGDVLELRGRTQLRIQRDASGRVTGFLFDGGRVRNIGFERID